VSGLRLGTRLCGLRRYIDLTADNCFLLHPRSLGIVTSPPRVRGLYESACRLILIAPGPCENWRFLHGSLLTNNCFLPSGGGAAPFIGPLDGPSTGLPDRSRSPVGSSKSTNLFNVVNFQFCTLLSMNNLAR